MLADGSQAGGGIKVGWVPLQELSQEALSLWKIACLSCGQCLVGEVLVGEGRRGALGCYHGGRRRLRCWLRGGRPFDWWPGCWDGGRWRRFLLPPVDWTRVCPEGLGMIGSTKGDGMIPVAPLQWGLLQGHRQELLDQRDPGGATHQHHGVH